MNKNTLIWIRIGDTDKGKIYNSEDIDPIAMWLGKLINGHEDESFIDHYRREACEVYDLAHRIPEWAVTAKESPFYHLTESYQREQEENWRRFEAGEYSGEVDPQAYVTGFDDEEDSQEYRWNDEE